MVFDLKDLPSSPAAKIPKRIANHSNDQNKKLLPLIVMSSISSSFLLLHPIDKIMAESLTVMEMDFPYIMKYGGNA